VVNFVRAFYLEYNTSPAVRMLVKAMAQKYGEPFRKQPKQIAAVAFLFAIFLCHCFNQHPHRWRGATKIAGLPKPAKCL
jgi:tRNA 2-thiouridine synthesizing protein E